MIGTAHSHGTRWGQGYISQTVRRHIPQLRLLHHGQIVVELIILKIRICWHLRHLLIILHIAAADHHLINLRWNPLVVVIVLL
jgi:hypothetical protein